ncbi:MAG: glutamate 5-kinase [Chitinivibrionales bacterium]|nr:glutamate 5-kinase [Chitinivibrionales bacterium]
MRLNQMDRKTFYDLVTPQSTIAVKIGSRILSSPTKAASVKRIRTLVEDIVELKKKNVSVVLISSGAIAHGMHALGLSKRPTEIPLQQACASIGQHHLMQMYDSLFAPYHIVTGQVLLTWDDLRDKTRYLNLRNTLFHLLNRMVIPVVNENDSVGIEEIRFGDNDTLGAQIAMCINAGMYIILTDVDGLYEGNPHACRNARQIPVVPRITPEIRKLVMEKKSTISVGGMATKLGAAEMVTRAGIPALIGNGYSRRLSALLSEAKAGTLFMPSERKMKSRQRWIAFAGKSRGTLRIDTGACSAITRKGKSLLPAGIKNVSGTFKSGDTVEIHDEKRTLLARGLTNYSSEEIKLICGRNSSEISSRLGQKSFDEVIHRDNMVLMQ